MCSSAVNLIEEEKFDKIVWIRNNVEVRHTKPLGYLPGDMLDKLFPFAEILSDHIGGEDIVRRMVEQGQIEIMHLGYIRGRDIKNAIIICSEAENLTTDHVQLLISRVGENSEIWFNGDFRQVDNKIYENDNGLFSLLDTLSGNPLFAHVRLNKVERSKTAALADLFDGR